MILDPSEALRRRVSRGQVCGSWCLESLGGMLVQPRGTRGSGYKFRALYRHAASVILLFLSNAREDVPLRLWATIIPCASSIWICEQKSVDNQPYQSIPRATSWCRSTAMAMVLQCRCRSIRIYHSHRATERTRQW